MSLFKNFFRALSSPSRPRGTFYTYSVKCKRCGEIIQGQVNVNNDPSLEYDENDKPFYLCRKVLIGSRGMCFQQIEVIFKFDENRRVLSREIIGGEFVDEQVP
jgi:hypothetical protein